MPVFSKHSDREYEALEKKLKAAEDKLKAVEEKLSEQKSASKQLDDQRKAAEKAQAEQKEENDLLLAQLHQVQEELEKYFLENKTQQEASAKLNDALAKANDALAKANAELKKAQDQLVVNSKQAEEAKADLEALQASESDLKSENDLLLAQLHQVQEELEKYYLGNKDLESAVTQAAELIRRTRYAIVNHQAEVAGAFARSAPARPTKVSKVSKKP